MDSKEQRKFKDAIRYLSSKAKPVEMPQYLKEMILSPSKNWAFTLNGKYSVVGNVSFADPVESTLFPGFYYESSAFTLQDEEKKIRKAKATIMYHSDLRRWDGQINFLDERGNCDRIVSIVSAVKKEF